MSNYILCNNKFVSRGISEIEMLVITDIKDRCKKRDVTDILKKMFDRENIVYYNNDVSNIKFNNIHPEYIKLYKIDNNINSDICIELPIVDEKISITYNILISTSIECKLKILNYETEFYNTKLSLNSKNFFKIISIGDNYILI